MAGGDVDGRLLRFFSARLARSRSPRIAARISAYRLWSSRFITRSSRRPRPVLRARGLHKRKLPASGRFRPDWITAASDGSLRITQRLIVAIIVLALVGDALIAASVAVR
jgi:hypothetical protein